MSKTFEYAELFVKVLTIGGISIYNVTADPNGLLVATKGSLAVFNGEPAAVYQNADGASTWVQMSSGSGTKILKKRVVLADLPAALGYGVVFDSPVPAHKAIFGAFVFVNEAPTGGGVASCTMNVIDPVAGNSFVEIQQLVGAVDAEYILKLNINPSGLSGTSQISIQAVDRTLSFTLLADVDLDTLTTFDVTAYIIYVDTLGLP